MNRQKLRWERKRGSLALNKRPISRSRNDPGRGGVGQKKKKTKRGERRSDGVVCAGPKGSKQLLNPE